MLAIQSDLDGIVSAIKDLLPNAKVYLFGAYANGEYGGDSDLDLCIVAPSFNARRADIRFMIRNAIKDKTRLPLDILAFTSEEFEERAKSRSTLQYTVHNKGILLNEQH